jgi:hypothetical protein
MYAEIDGDFFNFRRAGDNALIAQIESSTLDTGNEDIFVVQVVIDSDGRYVLIMYGMTWRGTWASAKYYKNILEPSIGTFSLQYYIVRWRDSTFGDSNNQIPDAGDTYSLLAQG